MDGWTDGRTDGYTGEWNVRHEWTDRGGRGTRSAGWRVGRSVYRRIDQLVSDSMAFPAPPYFPKRLLFRWSGIIPIDPLSSFVREKLSEKQKFE